MAYEVHMKGVVSWVFIGVLFLLGTGFGMWLAS